MDNFENSDSRLFWAFLVDESGTTSKHRLGVPKRNLDRFRVISCSPRVKEIGVRAGMYYDEARELVPDMRVIVCNR